MYAKKKKKRKYNYTASLLQIYFLSKGELIV